MRKACGLLGPDAKVGNSGGHFAFDLGAMDMPDLDGGRGIGGFSGNLDGADGRYDRPPQEAGIAGRGDETSGPVSIADPGSDVRSVRTVYPEKIAHNDQPAQDAEPEPSVKTVKVSLTLSVPYDKYLELLLMQPSYATVLEFRMLEDGTGNCAK